MVPIMAARHESASLCYLRHMRVEDIVKKKGDDVVTLGVDATLRDLVQTLAAHRIGAVLVMDGADLAGIVSERDVVRHLAAAATLDAPVTDFMTADVTTCVLGDEIQKLATLMTERRFRHLPVLEDGAVIAIVSLGDVVKARLSDLEAERDHLESFVHGT